MSVGTTYNLKEHGFCFLPKTFSNSAVLSARNGLWSVINGKYETGVCPETRFWNLGDDINSIIKIDKPHLCNRAVWNLVTDKQFGTCLATVTNAKQIQIWHSQVVWKPKSKEDSGNAGWHRDSQYWPFWSKKGLYTAWIALSDVCSNSGPVRFIPGSNHWKDLSGLDFFDKNLLAQDKILKQKNKKVNIVRSTLDKGEVSIHSSLTYHSSEGNKEDAPRVGMVVHFCTESAKQIKLKGENSSYLNSLNDDNVSPIIYKA
ncbi:MAG: hypothetical protein CMG60_05435 [Candidatus Marinimicrobia bacterium]|nr:hypothetical protein [Candidatus Neomarinimicrobiota bacterium]